MFSEAGSTTGLTSLGNLFMIVFSLNLLVFSFDFSRIKSITIAFAIVAVMAFAAGLSYRYFIGVALVALPTLYGVLVNSHLFLYPDVLPLASVILFGAAPLARRGSSPGIASSREREFWSAAAEPREGWRRCFGGLRCVGGRTMVPRESGVDVRASLCHRSPKGESL